MSEADNRAAAKSKFEAKKKNKQIPPGKLNDWEKPILDKKSAAADKQHCKTCDGPCKWKVPEAKSASKPVDKQMTKGLEIPEVATTTIWRKRAISARKQALSEPVYIWDELFEACDIIDRQAAELKAKDEALQHVKNVLSAAIARPTEIAIDWKDFLVKFVEQALKGKN